MYYLFIIKDDFNKEDSEYLYNILKKLKYMHKENYSYGVSLFYSICNLFDSVSLKRYIRLKYKFNNINNKFYLDKYNYFEIRKSCCIINNHTYLRQILCIFYIYNKNIFICNFEKNICFWLKDKFK